MGRVGSGAAPTLLSQFGQVVMMGPMETQHCAMLWLSMTYGDPTLCYVVAQHDLWRPNTVLCFGSA